MSTLSDTRRIRRTTCGIGLLGFGALLVVQAPLDPTDDTTFYDAALAHPGLLTASALTLLGSAVLTVPAIAAIVHQARDRGSLVAGLGGLFTLLGALGHTALAVIYLLMRSLAGGDPAQMMAFEDRFSSDPATGVVGLVLLTSFGLASRCWPGRRGGPG